MNWNDISMKLAWIVPKRVAYWCFIRVVTYGTVGKYSDQLMGELTVIEANKRFYNDHFINKLP